MDDCFLQSSGESKRNETGSCSLSGRVSPWRSELLSRARSVTIRLSCGSGVDKEGRLKHLSCRLGSTASVVAGHLVAKSLAHVAASPAGCLLKVFILHRLPALGELFISDALPGCVEGAHPPAGLPS